MELGYACINMTLGKQKILTGRCIRKAKFLALGLPEASRLAVLNAKDLLTVIKWNNDHNIKLFRVGSDVFPWMSEYELTDLPDYNEIKQIMLTIGEYVTKNNIRLTFHPGPFNILGSEKPSVVENTIKELNQHSQIFDMMGLVPSHYNTINIHVGTAKPSKEIITERWCNNFLRLNESTRKRLTIENDDKASMYSVVDLYNLIYLKVGVPIVFDHHHHKFNTGDLQPHEALEIACSTWPDGITPIVHYSESKSLHENDSKIRAQAHSDYVFGPIDNYGFDVDTEIEAKHKELALLKYRAIEIRDGIGKYSKQVLSETI